MIVIGITGSIGMGKSTAAGMLNTMGIPVHDSDAEVHRILSSDEQARLALAAQFPFYKYFSIYGRKNKNGTRGFNRKRLGKLVFENSIEREKLERILHPLVRKSQNEFMRIQKNAGADIVALDIPLLFETGAEQNIDYAITVSAPAFIQKERVMSRPNMTEKKFQAILERQMPDDEKCARADFVIPSGLGKAKMMQSLKEIIYNLRNIEEEQEEQTA
ncbi:MAG: dephospho-CoA kinase [Bdellovibrionales bacterium]